MKMSSDEFREINYSAILNKYVYYDEQGKDYDDKTINSLLDESENHFNEKIASDGDFTALIKANPEVGDFKLIAQSNVKITEGNEIGEYIGSEGNKSDRFPETHLIACAFKDKDNNIYVVYRGTGDGKWVDNGEGMTKESTLMQRAAAEFFDTVIEEQKGEPIGKVIVTGHSKGGNMAQYVTMAAENCHMIDSCYSINGQGFSEKAIASFKTNLKESYETQINKMVSINGQNDYVHDLGNPIIPKERTYFVETFGEGFNEWHNLDYMFRFEYDANGNRIGGSFNFSEDKLNVEQGPIGRFAKELSKRMMALPEEELNDCAISIMTLVEKFLDGGGVYKVGTGEVSEATIEEYLGLFSAGIPVIINTAIACEDTKYLLETLGIPDEFVVLIDELQTFAKEKGIDDFCGYIAEDPFRMITVYASLDLGKKPVNEAILKIFSAGIVGKMIIHLKFPLVSLAIDFVAAAYILKCIANHIIQKWDVICDNIKLAADYVKDKIVDLYNEIKRKIEVGANIWVSTVCKEAEELITKGARVVNKFIDTATDFWTWFKEQTVKSIKSVLFASNPLFYIIASKVYKAVQEPVKINLSEIGDCVARMNNLAWRVEQIDQRLDDLYWRLAKNNIEQGEGLFTSLANIYNLFRADLNVDEGASIRRKAGALSDLYDDFVRTEKWVLENVPKGI